MKCQPTLKEINILTKQIKSRNPTLTKVLKSMEDEITYLFTKDQDEIPKYHIENILKSYTQADALYVIVFFQHLQSLGVLKNQFQNQLLEFIESLTIVEEIELKAQQFIMTLINQDISLSNLVYSIRCLRQCSKLYNSSNKIVKLSIVTQIDQIISLLGKSARSLLCNSEKEDSEKQSYLELSLQNFIILFSSIIDGEKDPDFDVTFALKSLNSFFLELNQLLILLDPNVVNIIKANLSRQLKGLLSQNVAPINQQLQTFRCVETLLIGNPTKFCDFLTVLSQHIASDQHSSQKALSFKVIMVCAKHGVFRECLQNDSLKQEITQFYSTITNQSKIENFIDNTTKLRQIQAVIGNIVSLENMFDGVSDNEFVIDSIVQFNLNFSESLFQQDIKLPIILQNSIKKCHKHLIKTIQPTKLLRSFFYFCYVLDFEIREEMVEILLKQKPNIEITKIIVEIIYSQKGNFSYHIWLQTLELYFQLDIESEYRQEFKGLFLHNFENIVEQTILFSLVSCSFVQQSMQLLIQIMNKHFQRIRFLWQSIVDKLIKKLKEINQLEYIETICSLLIMRYEKCQQFDQEVLLNLVELQDDTVTQVILSNVITICSRYDIENIDILLGLLLQCKESDKVLIAMFEIIKNRHLLEQSWDIILQIIKKQHHSSTDIDLVMGKLYQKIVDNEQYAMAFFQLAVTVQCSIHILFQILNSISDQEYANKQLNLELFSFLIQSKLRYNSEFAIELCKWTFKVKNQEIITQQYNYLQQALEFENEFLVIEITRIIRFYLQEYPQEMSLASIVESYDFLYSTNHPKLTKCLCIIIDDLLDILGVFFRMSQQNIKTLFCLYGKIIQLRLYPDFEECIIENKFILNLDKIFTLFKIINYRSLSNQDNYYNSQYQQLLRRLINLKQSTTQAIDIVQQTLQFVDKDTAYTILDYSIPEIQESIRKQFSDQ